MGGQVTRENLFLGSPAKETCKESEL